MYVVIHLCDIMCSFRVEANLCRFLSLVYKCIWLEIQLSRGEEWNPINTLTPLHFCLKPGPGFAMSYRHMSWYFFLCSWNTVKMSG
jgi:hypothetical protein